MIDFYHPRKEVGKSFSVHHPLPPCQLQKKKNLLHGREEVVEIVHLPNVDARWRLGHEYIDIGMCHQAVHWMAGG